ncbi:thiamine phosphate synthase [Nocardioides daejeonensis]|uniref:thiamine phosphate synthase n=1 Tax=Nocardioides daejeonensis TaxID=1046556 RepID=UPI000D74E0F6|nr:thiamine phosphate synthase [Nocardioides daejeonensis]
MTLDLPPLLVLTDRAQLRLGRSLVSTVAECARAGLTHVVLRELDLPPRSRAALAARLVATGVSVIAAHRPLPKTIGLHLPAGALPPGDPPGVPGLLGRSCHTRAEVAAAAADGCDYVTLGPYADTRSKPGYGPPLAVEEYAGAPLPAYALGGVDPANAARALAAGAYGIAVMGAVMRSSSPAAVVRDLLAVAADTPQGER